MKFITKVSIYLFAFAVVFAHVETVEAKRRNNREESWDSEGRQKQNKQQKQNRQSEDSSYEPSASLDETASDSDLVRAVNDRRREDFVEGGSLTVVKVLPDDNSGLEHQKWVVRLSNGELMQAVYNLDMCPRVPLKVGDVIAMGGQFIWTNKGGLLHWLHHDPRGRRPDGYVYVNGQYYCKE
ncbi:DUF3465 domain-containing protein [Bdellovibrio bacteriovorus]|uniref:DUF3465 domain-containing protein n=1 Tax=Bdellovibrio bacteriovorus TaxID=959 RepID=A0A1Z3NAD2_BDEBC|nr:DUF3465 domain-containing protein [Bdellovibrio bacteriovorus]ASD64430.1 hypothetical protein B9G79_13065 [Bdellovibrio bacteriovorus]